MASTAPGAQPGRHDARSGLLARNWIVVLLRGLLALTVGILAGLMPAAALGGLVLVFAAYMLADGVLTIVAAVRAGQRHERWGWLVLEGVANIAAGAVALFLPAVAVVTIVLVVAVWAIFSGGLMLVAAFRLRPDHGRVWLGLGGGVSLALGIVLLLAPITGAIVLTLWFGVYAAAFGIVLVILAFRLRRHAAA